jgi:hypothetical protein
MFHAVEMSELKIRKNKRRAPKLGDVLRLR